MKTVEIFMRRIIDYAGMFPPANLTLEEALRAFDEYQRHELASFLGRFILPLDRLARMPLGEAQAILEKMWGFSGLIRIGSATLGEACAEIDRIAACLRILQASSPGVAANPIEVDLPAEAWIEADGYRNFRQFLDLIEAAFAADRKIFVELNWRKPYKPLMACMAERSQLFGLKLRTGGVTPESIPPSRAVAAFLLAAAEHKLPIKATAGLHVPVPNLNPDVGARMHGFLNFFCAGFLAFSQRGGEQAIIDTLETLSYQDFAFGESSMRCGTVEFSKHEIEQLRSQWLLSFGSCSFLEPIEHLVGHGLIR